MTAVCVSLVWACIVAGLLFAQHKHQGRFFAQIERLCQRIQAPDVAVAQHIAETAPVEDEPDDDDPTFTNIP